MNYTKVLAPVFLLLLISFSHCDEVKEAINVDFSRTITQVLPVNETRSGTDIVYSNTYVIDATSDAEIQKYADNIVDIEVETLEFQIENYSSSVEGEVSLKDGTLGFGNIGASSATATCMVDNLPVTLWSGTGFFTLAGCATTIDEIAAALTSDQSVKVFLDGTLSQGPVAFDLVVRLKLNVAATPL